MQNKFINKINVLSLIIALLFLILIIFIAKSVYLLSFITILLLVLIILTGKNVKFYIETLKNTILVLLFAFTIYIMLSRNIIGSIIFSYKMVLIILYIKQFLLMINFPKLINGINSMLKPIGKKDITNKISYNLALLIFFIDIYINSKDEVFKNYELENKFLYTFSIKRNIFPRLFLTISKSKNLENSLKIKNYKIKYDQINKESMICILTFIVLFIIVFFKEVVL